MNYIKSLSKLGKSFMEQHNCKFCHKTASHYVSYKDLFVFLCSSKKCSHKFDIESGIFIVNFELSNTGE